MKITLNESWISGKYANGEINTAYSTVAVTEPEFFAQGDDADQIITQIHSYWINNDVTSEDAFNWWVDTFLFDY